MNRTLSESKMDERIKMKVVEIISETDTMKTFKFLPVENKKLNYLPGQFVFLYTTIEGEEIKRAYSVASSPLDETLDLGLELVENGKMTTLFHNQVKVGDVFEVSQGKGHFKYTEDIKKAVMLAGGSGITPMRSITRYCTQKNLNTDLILLYSARTEDKIVYNKEFEDLAVKNSHFKFVKTLTRNQDPNWNGKQGRITKEFILEQAGDITNAMFYLCGSTKMVKSMVDMVKELGVDRTKIKMDLWG